MIDTRADILLLHAPRRPSGQVLPSWHDRLREALPYAKRLEIERRAPGERAASLDALALLWVGLDRVGETTARPRDLRYDGQGAPRLAGGRAFSLAHSASYVACVVADTPAQFALGLDLEDLGSAVCQDPARHARLRDWVAIEAVLKAAGRGLRESTQVVLEPDAEEGTRPAVARCRFAGFRAQRYRVLEPALNLSCLCAIACPVQVEPLPRSEPIELDSPLVSAALERRFGLPA